MQIVRTLWGTDISESMDKTAFKSFESNQYDDEIVLCWGQDNKDLLDDLGYPNYMISSSGVDPNYADHDKMFYHKLEAIKLCDEWYDEYVLIDWDIHSSKTVDSTFGTKLQAGPTVQAPLYAYPSNYKALLDLYYSATSSIVSHFNEFDNRIASYSWDYSGSYVLPQFAFYYSRGANLGATMLSRSLASNLKSNVEEFALFAELSCSLDYYIANHEPEVALGHVFNPNPDFNNARIALETYITKSKDIYFSEQ